MTSLYRKEIGKLLQNAREELRLTLSEVSVELHIRAHYLQALETGELTNLPGSAYIKGYLQSYATFLHLDKDEMIRRFELLENDFPEKNLFFPHVFSKDKNPSHSIAYSALFLVLIIYTVWFFAFRPDSMPSPVLPAPQIAVGNSANYIFNHACAISQLRVYPPCYRADKSNLKIGSLLPLHRQIISVMELTNNRN